MKRKRIILSLLLVAFCALVVPAGLVFNGISYTRAAGAVPKVTGQHTPATTAKPTPSAIVQGNGYHGSTVCDPNPFIRLCLAIVQGNVLYGHTGLSVYALNAKTGVLLWQYQVRSSNYCLGYTAVDLLGIVNGVVYVNTCRPDCPSHLAALKASDGSQLWCSPVNFAAYSGILGLAKVAKGIVYISPYTPCGDSCAYGPLYALKESDGSQLWNYAPNGMVALYGVDQGVVYTTIVYEAPGSFSQDACAFNTIDGSKRWCHSNAEIIGLVRGVVYVTAYNANYSGYSILALKESDGTKLWRYSGGSQEQEFLQALVQLDVIYISAYLPSNGTLSGTLCAVNVSNGSQRWCSISNPYTTSLKVLGGIIYNIGNIYSGGIQAFSTSTGALLWTKQAASLIGLGQSVAYVLTSNYHVEGINATNGSLLWTYNATRSGTAYFAPTDGVIYYNTSHGLRALSASTGTLLWSHFAATNVYLLFQSDSRAIAYVVSSNTTSTLNAYNSSNGTLLWKYTNQ